MFTSAAVIFAINLATSLLKKYVMPKYGKIGVQVLVFVFALGAAVYFNYGADYVEYIKQGAIVFSMAVAFYEVVLSKLDFFKKGV